LNYFSIQFLIYELRWILSAFIMMIPLFVLVKFKCCEKSKFQEYIHLIIVQIIGAFIFFPIDKIIFKG